MGAGVPDAVDTYVDLVLNASLYPDGFPQHWRLSYVPESRQLVVECDLPGIDVIPTAKAYRYVKASDSITETARPQTQVKAQYASVIAQTALRVVDEIFEADRWRHIESNSSTAPTCSTSCGNTPASKPASKAPDDWRDPEPDRAPSGDEQPAAIPTRVPLRAGQNVALTDAALTITISWRTGAHDLDASAILLNRSGRVRSDADFIFYNQPATSDGAVRHTATTPGAATSTESARHMRHVA